MRVALIDRYKIGGTCLHVGCIPTKCMLESADLYDRTKRAQEFGITTGALSVDPAVIAKRRQAVVDRLHKGLQALVKKHKVEYIHGQARLKGHKVVEIELLDDDGKPAGWTLPGRNGRDPGQRDGQAGRGRPRRGRPSSPATTS